MSLVSALLTGDRGVAAPAYKPEGEMRYAVYVTISPTWFDPAEVATARYHAVLVLLCPA